jgi:DNA polymerase delta subunit 2
VIFGIVYKDMPLKPSILKGMESILGSKKVESFVSEKEDSLVIEDFSGRVHVTKTEGVISPGLLITGVVVGAKGRLNERGLFIIEEIIYPQCDSYSLPQNVKPSQNTGIFSILSNNNNLIAFISGLHFGKVDYTGRLNLARNLFLDIIQRRFVSDCNLDRLIKRITRLVIVGNSIYASEDVDLVEKGSFLKADLNSRVYRTLIQNFDEYDNYLNLLSNSIECDYMPGTDDISSSYFPANAVNKLMLPISSKNSSVNLVTNPYKFKVDDLLLLGSSGQNIDNIRRYSNIGPNSLDIMNKTIEWAHLCPSAPDTLRTYPIMESDPLILREIPHVYFAGNQNKFETQLSSYQEVPLRIIAIPDFSLTFSFVILDTSTLEVCEYNIELNN